jgi:crossover junction endodeoxyribonuclease RusA
VNVTLSWPPKELSPNGRLHFMQLAKAKASYRAACQWECKAQGLKPVAADSLHLTLTFSPPTRRRFDLDNLLARMKAGLDGVSDVVGVDDSKWSLTIKRGDPVKHGAVHIQIESAT